MARLGLLCLVLWPAGFAAGACAQESYSSPCHPVRQCITLTCKGAFQKEGPRSDAFAECMDWCRTTNRVAKGAANSCARRIGVGCLYDWYGTECVAARERCRTGAFRPEEDGGC